MLHQLKPVPKNFPDPYTLSSPSPTHCALIDIDTGCTALHVAAQLNLDRMAAQLLELGGSPSVQDKDGITSVMVSCSYGHLQTLQVLATRGIRFAGEL